jgi:hypothetical protein
MIMMGIHHAWRLLEGHEGKALRWFERMLPNRFRLSFAAVDGLEANAVHRSGRLPAASCSSDWRRLLDWQARYPSLDLERKGALLMLNNKLCLNLDNERLLAGDGPLLNGSRWSEAEAHYAYQRAFDPFMVREGLAKDKPEVLVEVFEKAPKGTRIKFMASTKFLVLCFEHGKVTTETSRALTVSRRDLEDLRGEVSPSEGKVWESKFWRCASYFPYHEKDDKKLWRQIGQAEEAAHEAIELAGKEGAKDKFLPDFAAENLHGVYATAGIARMQRKRYAEALKCFMSMVEMDPLGAWQRAAVGRALCELGRFDEALPQLEWAVKFGVIDRDEACARLSFCCERLGRAAEARLWKEKGENISSAIRALGTAARAA